MTHLRDEHECEDSNARLIKFNVAFIFFWGGGPLVRFLVKARECFGTEKIGVMAITPCETKISYKGLCNTQECGANTRSAPLLSLQRKPNSAHSPHNLHVIQKRLERSEYASVRFPGS